MKHWIRLAVAVIAAVTFTSIAATYASRTAWRRAERPSRSPSRRSAGSWSRAGDHAVRLRRRQAWPQLLLRRLRELWPPLLTKGTPHAGTGLRASLLGTTKRRDGKLEVTYNHHPLYYFVGDRKPGPATGQGLNQFGAPWWALSPAGREIH